MKFAISALIAFVAASTLITAFGVYYTAINSVTRLQCPNVCTIGLDQRLSNFMLLSTNPENNTISGLSYVLYPLAYENGYPITLRIHDTIGYTCDGSAYNLTSIDFQNRTATFVHVSIDTGICPT